MNILSVILLLLQPQCCKNKEYFTLKKYRAFFSRDNFRGQLFKTCNRHSNLFKSSFIVILFPRLMYISSRCVFDSVVNYWIQRMNPQNDRQYLFTKRPVVFIYLFIISICLLSLLFFIWLFNKSLSVRPRPLPGARSTRKNKELQRQRQMAVNITLKSLKIILTRKAILSHPRQVFQEMR